MYTVISSVVQRFDFKMDDAHPMDVLAYSDQFIIGTKNRSGLKVFVAGH